jgi:peptide/nickel transport system ATP-binding protein
MMLYPGAGAGAQRPVIEVEHLSMSYRTAEGWLEALADVSLQVQRGEIFGLVGESGSGKTTLALQLLGYRDARSGQFAGRVVFDDQVLSALPESALDAIRGRRISYVPQNPSTALNPSRRVGELISEVLHVHACARSLAEENRRTFELLDAVGLPDPQSIARKFPHQLSGGQQQRIAIALALACRPDLIVLDEPTTGLDVTTQRQILRLLSSLRVRFSTSMLYVTHDLGVIEELADRVGVMYAGTIAEIGATSVVFANPHHPYTAGLIASIPRLGIPLNTSAILRGSLKREEIGHGCAFQPRCPHAVAACRDERQTLGDAGNGHLVACREWRRIAASKPPARERDIEVCRRPGLETPPLLELQDASVRYGPRFGGLARLLHSAPPAVVREVSLTIARGEVFALVGESGSGKSTLARAISGLLPLASGSIMFDGGPLQLLARRNQALRRRIQFVFQNPDSSLNPRRTIGESLARPLALFFRATIAEIRLQIAAVLDDVQLPPSYTTRYPDELSGGERQRVAIARALLAKPDLMICDEILSALDVSVQASILGLLRRLRKETGITMIFISHDLAVVEQLADRVGVLYKGQLLESGLVDEIFAPPHHPYTLSLLMAVPGSRGVERGPALPGRQPTAEGCSFAGRCPVQLENVCLSQTPPWRRCGRSKSIRCHIDPEHLEAERA